MPLRAEIYGGVMQRNVRLEDMRTLRRLLQQTDEVIATLAAANWRISQTTQGLPTMTMTVQDWIDNTVVMICNVLGIAPESETEGDTE